MESCCLYRQALFVPDIFYNISIICPSLLSSTRLHYSQRHCGQQPTDIASLSLARWCCLYQEIHGKCGELVCFRLWPLSHSIFITMVINPVMPGFAHSPAQVLISTQRTAMDSLLCFWWRETLEYLRKVSIVLLVTWQIVVFIHRFSLQHFVCVCVFMCAVQHAMKNEYNPVAVLQELMKNDA